MLMEYLNHDCQEIYFRCALNIEHYLQLEINIAWLECFFILLEIKFVSQNFDRF